MIFKFIILKCIKQYNCATSAIDSVCKWPGCSGRFAISVSNGSGR